MDAGHPDAQVNVDIVAVVVGDHVLLVVLGQTDGVIARHVLNLAGPGFILGDSYGSAIGSVYSVIPGGGPYHFVL